MDRDTFYERMISFLEKRKEEETVEIAPDDNLIRKGWVDSFMIMEIITHIELLTGASVNIDDLEVKHIQSLDAMYNYFILKEIT